MKPLTNRGAAGTGVVFGLDRPCLIVAMWRDGESASPNHDLLVVAVVHIGDDEGAGWACKTWAADINGDLDPFINWLTLCC